MSASLKDLTVDEFLDWERRQPARYEFDGVQPVAMTGGSVRSDRVITRLTVTLDRLLPPSCEVMGENVKLITSTRVRYPDVKVVCNSEVDPTADYAEPIVVFEVLSPSTELTDRRVKSVEYRTIDSVQIHVMLPQDRIAATILRRSTGWVEEEIEGADAILLLPEISVSFPLGSLHQPRA